MKNNLSLTEYSDFSYLLELMTDMYGVPEFSWLPELFCIVGYESLLKLSKVAGGETITIPTLDEMLESVEAFRWYYDIYVSHTKKFSDVPDKLVKFVKIINKVIETRS